MTFFSTGTDIPFPAAVLLYRRLLSTITGYRCAYGSSGHGQSRSTFGLTVFRPEIRSLLILGVLATVVGCSSEDKVGTKSAESPNRIIKDELILAADDAQFVRSLPTPKDYSSKLTYSQPRHSKETVSIESIVWTPGSTVIRMKSVGRSDLLVYSKATYCTEHWLFMCVSRGASESFTKLETGDGSAYDVDPKGLGDSEKLSGDYKDYSFSSVPREALRSFKIVGASFAGPDVSLDLSDEQAAELSAVTGLLQKNEPAVNLRKIVLVANRFASNDGLNRAMSEKIRNRLGELSSIAAYSVALKDLVPTVGGLPDIADDFLLLLYRSEIMPKNDTALAAKFIDTYQNASGRVLGVAFDHAVQVEQDRIAAMLEEEYKARATLFLPLSQEKRDAASESVARKYYSDTLRAKEEGDTTLFAVRHKALMSTEALKGTSARFSLEMDKEMKEFLSSQFAQLINEHRQASHELSSHLQQMVLQVGGVADAMNKPADLNAEWQANQRFLIQQKIFDETNHTGGKRT